MWQAEKGSAFLRIVAELMAEDAEGARGVAETAGHVAGRFFIDEVSTEGFVLALQGELRGKEEVPVARCHYLIRSAGRHIQMMLSKHDVVNMFREDKEAAKHETYAAKASAAY
jgi:hypothetical protein